ncbi:hypothetical protein H8356DRAFT_1638543 [Neocallimastix lanati (nom. inval.)]|jgi:hypothetical protein|uniref:Uncharacterized protein n=1 Tax=Neocallimastix californiae TaxID=1754190 RepID=A0A1Y2DT81_9FUNG|nr:hypothetical protein H8356DRAFT_1638543 [Neocallimastix sp. JGI-2020a]ORY61865.1 hypothetical protein LY90DRAFT_668505 [Neocallimastix californiae]|eukprot:ORY61865.1 hypothetical protein LY90DRAFT_668505 [Neocallimastix californiae]
MENTTEILKQIPHPIQYFPEELNKEYNTPRTDDTQNFSICSPSYCSSVSSMSSASSFQPPFLTRGNSNFSGMNNYTTNSSSVQSFISLNGNNNNNISHNNGSSSPVKIVADKTMDNQLISKKSSSKDKTKDANLLSPSSAASNQAVNGVKEKQKIDFAGLHSLLINIAGVENIFNLDCASHRLVRIISTLLMFIIYPELRRNLKQIAAGPRGKVLAAEYITYYIICFKTVEHISVTLPVLICAIIYIDRYVQQRKLRVASELGHLFQKLPDQYSRIAVTHDYFRTKIIIVALAVSSKILYDGRQNLTRWAHIINVETKNLAKVERDFICEINYKLCIDLHEYKKWIRCAKHLLHGIPKPETSPTLAERQHQRQQFAVLYEQQLQIIKENQKELLTTTKLPSLNTVTKSGNNPSVNNNGGQPNSLLNEKSLGDDDKSSSSSSDEEENKTPTLKH